MKKITWLICICYCSLNFKIQAQSFDFSKATDTPVKPDNLEATEFPVPFVSLVGVPTGNPVNSLRKDDDIVQRY